MGYYFSDIDEFIKKIKEAIIKLQKTLPKQLEEKEIEMIEEQIREYVIFVLKGGGVRADLSSLLSANEFLKMDESEKLKMVFSGKQMPEKGKYDEYIPYLEIYISDSLLAIANHARQILYSTDEEKYKPTNNYFVKSHAEVCREQREKEKIGNSELAK